MTSLSQADQKLKVILQEKTLSVSYFWLPKNPDFNITFSYFLYYRAEFYFRSWGKNRNIRIEEP